LHHRLENPAHIRDSGRQHGETPTRTGDTTISVVRSSRAKAAKYLEDRGVWGFARMRRRGQTPAICTLIDAIQEMVALPSPFAPAVLKGGVLDVRLRPDARTRITHGSERLAPLRMRRPQIVQADRDGGSIVAHRWGPGELICLGLCWDVSGVIARIRPTRSFADPACRKIALRALRALVQDGAVAACGLGLVSGALRAGPRRAAS
jgi:hypothetical protein